MNTKKLFAVLLAVLLALTATACGGNGGDDQEELLSIGIMQFMQHAALDDATAGFKKALADNGLIDGVNIRINEQNAQGDTNNCSTIADQFVAENVDLVLAVATPAAQAMAGKTTEIPILGTAVTDYVVAKLVDSDEVPGGNVSGTSDMNPVKEQIDLLVEFAPEAKKIGLIYTASEDNSALQAGLAKEAIEALGLEPVIVTINNSNDVQQAVQNIVTRCDALYVPTDNTMASAMPIVRASPSKRRFRSSQAIQRRDGGRSCDAGDAYWDPIPDRSHGRGILKNGQTSQRCHKRATGFDYVVNGTVAKNGIAIPDYLLDFVEMMEARINRLFRARWLGLLVHHDDRRTAPDIEHCGFDSRGSVPSAATAAAAIVAGTNPLAASALAFVRERLPGALPHEAAHPAAFSGHPDDDRALLNNLRVMGKANLPARVQSVNFSWRIWAD